MNGKMKYDKTRKRDKVCQYKARKNKVGPKERQSMARRGNERQSMTRRGKKRLGKERRGKPNFSPSRTWI